MEDLFYNNVVGAIFTGLFLWCISSWFLIREMTSELKSREQSIDWQRARIEELESKYDEISDEIEDYRDEDASSTAKIKRLEVDLKSAKDALREISAIASERPKPTSLPTWPPTTDNQE